MNWLAGVCKGVLIGTYDSPNAPRLILGVDAQTGERKWRLEVRPPNRTIVFGGWVAYNEGTSLVFVDPFTGQSVSTIAFPGTPFGLWQVGDLLLVYMSDSHKVAVARP